MKLVTTHMIRGSDLGYHSNLFGGFLLAWLDEAGVAFACQLCDTPRMVTVSMKDTHFVNPVKAGQILKIYAQVNEIGGSSVTLDMEARRHNVYSGKQKIVLKTQISYVRIDEEGSSIPISERVHKKHPSKSRKLNSANGL